jgi:uncharacterized protein
MGKIDKILAALTGLLLMSCSFSSKFYDPSKNYRPIENINSQDIWFEYKNLKIHTLLLFPEEDIALNRLLILLQGKGGNASDWSEFAMPFVKKGYHVWIPEYPGHGLSEGKPSHRKVYKSMNSIVGKMIELEVVNSFDKAILGFSLGANLATKLAVNYESYVNGVIIDGGCSAFDDVAVGTTEGGSFWVRLFVSSPYPAKQNVTQLSNSKLLIIHSVDDSVMPIEMGELLYNNSNSEKKIWKVDGAHCQTIFNKTDEYIKKIEWIFEN